MVDLDNFSIERVETDQKPVVANLIQLYLYDMAAQTPFAIGPDGCYAYDLLDAFWDHAYLLLRAKEIAGFALVINHCPITGTSPCWFMAEFFVLRPYRRHGLGTKALAAILARHPGRWHIATHDQNPDAARFWTNALVRGERGHTEWPVRYDDMDWIAREFHVSSKQVDPQDH